MSGTCVHAGIRCKMNVSIHRFRKHILYLLTINVNAQGPADIENDDAVGFQIITSDDIDDLGISEIIKRIRKRVGDSPVYLRYLCFFIMENKIYLNVYFSNKQSGY